MQQHKGKTFVNIILLFGVLLLASCDKEDVRPSEETLTINDFIWGNLNEVYLWNDFIPQNINKDREFDSKEYFDKLLYKAADKWSFITDDYEGLMNSFNGIEQSFGHNFKLYLLSGTNDVIGIVKYVVPDSPADQAGIKRGDLFYKVNGITLTADNYQELLFENTSYTLSFGHYNQGGQIEQKADISLTSVVLSENPIHIRKTIDFEGYKIGYLSYNQFIDDYDDALVDAFMEFKNEGISDLVLDLRYNPGGSINTGILLSSMIAPAAVSQNKEIFSRLVWNEEISQYFLDNEGEESDNLISRFVTPEVTLDLQTVYILVTSNTASASEMVINCLDPYMEVVVIGSEHTTGKYVGSVTVRADDTDYDNWAMQPIVLKTSNASGVSDYSNGFTPEYIIEDDFDAGLGDLYEDMLGKAVELITGTAIGEPARVSKTPLPKNIKAITPERELRKQVLTLGF
jgi:C-terminal processing protease CtpA/Prc